MGRPRKIKAEHVVATQSETARNAGVSRQAVHASRHIAKKGAEIDVERSTDGLESLEGAQRRKETALADKHEMDALLRAGDLIEVAPMERAWNGVAQTIKEHLLEIPDAICGELASLTDERMIRDRLTKEIRTVLANMPEKLRGFKN
jgi:phage terminase Nu1 subunit (DNA packaging protein)